MTTTATLSPVRLTGKIVELQPLSPQHSAALSEAVAIDELWKSTLTVIPAPTGLDAYIHAAAREEAEGRVLVFAIVERATNRAIGSTRYLSLRLPHRGLEIGGTWLAKPWQRTAVNTEAKYLLLRYAFEFLACVRVEFKTDVLNERSRRAIERLGAKQEGIFRRHMIMPNGRIRDTVYYSLTDDDWPLIKSRLEEKMAGRG